MHATWRPTSSRLRRTRNTITTEDYRNRGRWNEYELAADEMVQRTSTDYARWHFVAADDKRWARIQVLRTVCREVRKALA